MVEVGRRIKELRQQKGKSQEELALAIGSTKSTISKYELGHREPSLETIQKIADALRVSFLDVVELNGSPNNSSIKEFMEEVRQAEKNNQKVIWGGDGLYFVDLTPDERIMFAFDRLNEEGRNEAVKRVEELTEIPKYRLQEPQDGPEG